MTPRPIAVYEPWISEEDVSAVTQVATHGWISSSGPEVRLFEQRIADYIGTREAVSVMNGTVAIHLALQALGIGPGDEVIVPDLTFIATAASVVHTGATPVFADVSPNDWNITAEEVLRHRTKRTKAVMVVHLYGNIADCEAIAEAAPDLLLIEDVAEGLGASRNGRRAGAFGKAATFSFYANKTITTGEGGMITTDDAALAERMRFLRDHAMSKERRYFHPELGWNYRMTALQAGIGLSQMRRVDEILRRKRTIAKGYAERLTGVTGIDLHPQPAAGSEGSFWMYSILLPDRNTRDRVMQALAENFIESRPFFAPMSVMPPFEGDFGEPRVVSSQLSARGLNLPSGPNLSESDLDHICATIRRALMMVEEQELETAPRAA
jgi:perosamine synthetase